jgi:phosphate/sulfate permease
LKRYALIISIALIVIGFIAARVGDNLSTVAENGMVQDSILMPVGAILFILGLLALLAAIIWYLVDFFKGRLKKDSA